jgi:hypothetical protein
MVAVDYSVSVTGLLRPATQASDLEAAVERLHIPEHERQKLQAQIVAAATAPPNRLDAHYLVLIEVVGTQELDGKDYWRLQFLPGLSAPSDVKYDQYRVLLGRLDGEMTSVTEARGPTTLAYIKCGDLQVPVDFPDGYPVELFSLTGEKTTVMDATYGDARVQVDRADTDRGRQIKIEVRAGGSATCSIQQTWFPGDSWWTSYDKQDMRNGSTLHAELLSRVSH